MGRRVLSRRDVLLVAVALVVAAWARVTTWPTVLGIPGVVLPTDPDAMYHLRRTLLTAQDFPFVPVFDPEMNWPFGGPCHWAPGFDLIGAAVLFVTGQTEGVGAETLAVATPVAWGLGVVALAAVVAKRLDGATWLAAALVALLPTAVQVSSFGQLDHHVAESLFSLALAAWALTAPDARSWRFEGVGAALLTVSVATFAGSTLYVAVTTVMLMLHRGRGWVGSGVPALALGAGALAIWFGALSADSGHWLSYTFPSLLQPLLLLVAAGGLAVVQLLADRLTVKTVGGAVAGVGVLLGVAGLVGRESAAGLFDWLLREDDWLGSIQEFRPWLHAGLASPLRQLGWLTYGLVLLLPAGLVAAWRADRSRGLAVAAWVGGLLVLALLQERFGRIFGPAACVVGVLALEHLPRRWRTLAAVGGLGLLLLDGAWRRPLVVQPPSALPEVDAALFLRANVDASREDRGVFSAWDLGHTLHVVGGTPSVANGFGKFLDEEGYALTEAGVYGDEPHLLEVMEARETRWAVLGISSYASLPPWLETDTPFEQAGAVGWTPSPTYRAEVPLAVAAAAGSGVPGESPHLEQLMPRHATGEAFRGSLWPQLFVYEKVPGATIEGLAAPGAQVRATTTLGLPKGDVAWHAWTVADADGRFELRLALPSGMDAGRMRTGPYLVTVDGAPLGVVEVTEEAVRQGLVYSAASSSSSDPSSSSASP